MDIAQEHGGGTDAADGAPADVARDSGAGDVTGTADASGADVTDGGSDQCRPACLYKLLNGCVPEGTCVRSGGNYCYSNGVKQIALPPGMADQQRTFKDGVLCATLQGGNTYVDPNGVVLGTVTVNPDYSTTLMCIGESPVVIPATCGSPVDNCSGGTCTP